jgi:hypothetical protein
MKNSALRYFSFCNFGYRDARILVIVIVEKN